MKRIIGTARVRSILVGVVMAAVLLPAGVAYGAWFLPEQRLTTNTADQRWPDISGTRVVYEDYRNQHDVGDINDPDTLFDIRVLNLTTGRSRNLTPYHTAYSSPSMSGDRVIWPDYGRTTSSGTIKGGIYYHNLATGKTRRLPYTGAEPVISGKRVAYTAYRRGHWRVYTFNLATGRETRVTTDGASPSAVDISGTRVVWQDHRNGLDFDIYEYDLVTKITKRITTDPGDQQLPKISGTNVVWFDNRNGILNDDIYRYDLATDTEYAVATAPGTQWFPEISGSKIVWMDERNGDTDVYFYDLVTATEHQVADNPEWQGNATVSGNRIVYEDSRAVSTDGMDLYLTQIAVPVVTAVTPLAIAPGAGATVTGTLKDGTKADMPGQQVTLESSPDDKTWTDEMTAVTDVNGAFSLQSAPVTTRRYLRVRFAGNSSFPAAVSATRRVRARLDFTGAPELTTETLTHGSSYRVWGYFTPEHASGSKQIRIRAYRYQRMSNGTLGYVFIRSFATTASNPDGSDLTKYSGHVRLLKTGRWRIRAYHPADAHNAKTWSITRFVRVR